MATATRRSASGQARDVVEQNPTFELAGVCSIEDDEVSCWDASRRPQIGLTAEVRRKLRAMTQPLSFVVGRKNRFVVVRHTPYVSLRYGSGNERLRVYEVDPDGGLSLFRISPDPAASSLSVSVTVGSISGPAVDVPFQKGAASIVGGVRLEVGPVERNPLNPYVDPLRGWGHSGNSPVLFGRWRVPVQRSESTPSGTFRIEAIGRDGGVVRYVDPSGRPVSAAKGEAYWKRRSAPGYVRDGTPTIEPVQCDDGQSFGMERPDLIWVGFSVAPRFVSRLRVRRVEEHSETIGPVALDPLQSSGP